VSYDTARFFVMDGDLIAWKGTAIGSRIIAWWTKSPWTHVGIACWWGPRLMVLESYPGKGTRAHPLSHDLTGAYWTPTGARWTPEAHGFALDLLDRRYSWTNCWKAAWNMRLVAREYMCAQYAGELLTRCGVMGLPESITPASLVGYFREPRALM
jgi:hypothetical protein